MKPTLEQRISRDKDGYHKMIKEYTHQNDKIILTWNASDNRAL